MNKNGQNLKEKNPKIWKFAKKMTNASVRLHTYECSSSCIMMAEGWGLIPLNKVNTLIMLLSRNAIIFSMFDNHFLMTFINQVVTCIMQVIKFTKKWIKFIGTSYQIRFCFLASKGFDRLHLVLFDQFNNKHS